jgi:hypothetical protein
MMSDEAFDQIHEPVERVKLGEVCIDTAEILLTDPGNHADDALTAIREADARFADWARENDPAVTGKPWPSHPLNRNENQSDSRQVTNAPNERGAALTVRTGYGDGFYPVYGIKNAEGRIIRIEIETLCYVGMPDDYEGPLPPADDAA